MTPEPHEEPDVLSWGLLKRFLNRLYAVRYGACDVTRCLRPARDASGECRRCERVRADEFDRKLHEPLPDAVIIALAERIARGDLPVRTVKRREP